MPQQGKKDEISLSHKSSGRRLWFPIYAIVIIYLVLLVARLLLRIGFRWDLYGWPESPFLISMMKLSNHLPVYTDPSDANSVVYSPGLEYLTFAILKPLGLALDIRFCRLVSIMLGMFAAAIGARTTARLVRSKSASPLPPQFSLISWGVFWLALSKNFLSDAPHPDNLHALHATAVFGLCFAALESGSFGTAVAAMAIAGIGVLTKQTEAACIVGPAVVFGLFNKWGWARWSFLVLIGILALAFSLYLEWLPQYARFYTLEVLSHQKLDLSKLGLLALEMFSGVRELLLFLTPIVAILFWFSGGSQRHYVVCWAAIGACSALPNFLAFLKVFGTVNNLGIIGFWMALLVWPAAVNLVEWLGGLCDKPIADSVEKARHAVPITLYLLLLCFLGALMPSYKNIPNRSQAAYCEAIDAAVLNDVRSGKNVLVTQGAEFYIHSGGKNIPLDQANSVVELNAAGQSAVLAKLKTRIRDHYYDRIYLRMGVWYGEDVLTEIYQAYQQTSAVPAVSKEAGGQIVPGFMEDCRILSPRQ